MGTAREADLQRVALMDMAPVKRLSLLFLNHLISLINEIGYRRERFHLRRTIRVFAFPLVDCVAAQRSVLQALNLAAQNSDGTFGQRKHGLRRGVDR